MPPRRRLRARRTRRPKLMRRKYGRMRIRTRRGRPQTVHTFVRGLTGFASVTGANPINNGTTFSTSGRISGGVAMFPYRGAFQLNGLTNVINGSEFGNLFDQYRIDKLILKFYLKVDPSTQTGNAGQVPRLYYVRDRDDSNAPADLNELKENQFFKERVLTPYRPVTLVCRPNALRLLYQSAVASQYQPAWGQWMDMNVMSTPHYTYKLAIDDLTNTNYYVDVEATVHFSCRQSR